MTKQWTLQDWREAMKATESEYSLCYGGEELGFSWSGCDICSNGLGGDLHKAVGFLHGKPTTEENSCDFEVCQDCICYIANGDEPHYLPDLEEKRFYTDDQPKNELTVLWETANIVQRGKVLIRDHEGHSEVDITFILSSTKAKQ